MLYCDCQQDENAVKKDPMPPSPPRFHVHSFCKTLTASDTSTHGGFSVLRRHADECLPPLVWRAFYSWKGLCHLVHFSVGVRGLSFTTLLQFLC